MADRTQVSKASSALGELHRDLLHGRNTMWHFAATGNAFLAAGREVQVAAMEDYNQKLRDNGSPQLQIKAGDLVRLF